MKQPIALLIIALLLVTPAFAKLVIPGFLGTPAPAPAAGTGEGTLENEGELADEPEGILDDGEGVLAEGPEGTFTNTEGGFFPPFSDFFDFFPLPPFIPPTLYIPPPGALDLDAEWIKPLDDVTIFKGSGNVVIQNNLNSRCVDRDTPKLTFKIETKFNEFDLSLRGANADLYLSNLNRTFVGSKRIVISCNGVNEEFILHVTDKVKEQDKKNAQEADDDSDELSIHFNAIRIPNAYEAQPGDIVPVTISVRNNGGKRLEDIKVAVTVPELSLRASFGPLDLKIGDRETRTLALELPMELDSGTYYARITVDGQSIHRVTYREIEVIQE